MIFTNLLRPVQGRSSRLQVFAVARTADFVVEILDTIRPNLHRDLRISEWEVVANRNLLPCVFVYKEHDQISTEEANLLVMQPRSIIVMCSLKLSEDCVLTILRRYLELIRIYIKKPGVQYPHEGFILRRGVTVEHVCHYIDRSLASRFKYALVWGTSTRYSQERVGINHVLHDGDIVRIIKKRTRPSSS